MTHASTTREINCTTDGPLPRPTFPTDLGLGPREINFTSTIEGREARDADRSHGCQSAPACTIDDPALAPFIAAAHADNTRRAYQSDLEHFLAWGGTIPSSDKSVARYLADHADCLAPGTLRRRLSAIAYAHYTAGTKNPCDSALVRLVLRGIARQRSTAVHQVRPLLAAQLLQIVGSLGTSPKDLRDEALLLLGFAGAFRRSELVALNIEDLAVHDAGLLVTLRRGKTDQTGRGRTVAVPFDDSTRCIAMAIQDWLNIVGEREGPLFRSIRKGGIVTSNRLSGRAVAEIIKRNVQAIGLNPAAFSGHSLRAGFVTSAAEAGADLASIREQTGHCSDHALATYVRRSTLFSDSSAVLALGRGSGSWCHAR